VPGFAKQPLFKKDRDGTATGKKSRLDLRKEASLRETNHWLKIELKSKALEIGYWT
jgi:hypothetical protein